MIEGILTPAYGRDYKSLKTAQEDFDKGKDFVLNTCRGESIYISKRDFSPGKMIELCYNKRLMTGFLKS